MEEGHSLQTDSFQRTANAIIIVMVIEMLNENKM